MSILIISLASRKWANCHKWKWKSKGIGY